MRLSTGSEHLPKTNLICAFQHHLFQELFVHYCPTSKYVDFHEVNCYSNWCTLHLKWRLRLLIHLMHFTIMRHTNQWYLPTVTISPLVITECYQLTHMIPPPPATTLVPPGTHPIEFLDGFYFAQPPPATFWSVKCMKVAEVKDLMNISTNKWLY